MCKNDFKPVNNLFVEPQDLLICNGIKVLTLYMTSCNFFLLHETKNVSSFIELFVVHLRWIPKKI